MTIRLGESEKKVRLDILGRVVPVEEEKPVEEPVDVVSEPVVVAEEKPAVVESEKKQVKRGRRRK